MIANERKAGHIEGYASALYDVLMNLDPEFDGHSKTYDPGSVSLSKNALHSYVFNLKGGGRHHQLEEYKDLAEVTVYILAETVNTLRGKFEENLDDTVKIIKYRPKVEIWD